MAEEATKQETTQGQGQREPQGEPQAPRPKEPTKDGTDWKAESRKWEERAKADHQRVAELEALLRDVQGAQEAGAAAAEDDGGIAAQVAELAAQVERLAQAQATDERRALVGDVARRTGVPEGLLHGQTREELEASARAAAEFAQSRAGGRVPDGGEATVSPVTRESIESVKDEVERVRLRAQHLDLYK